MIPSEDQATSQNDHLVGRTLHDGEYHIKCLLEPGEINSTYKIYLATHKALSIPLALKQILIDQPLPENVIVELNYILHGGDTMRHAAHINAHQAAFPSDEDSQTEHFSHEALLLARLQHPALPTLFDYFAEDGYWYLVSNYMPGATLRNHLRHYGSLSIFETLGYALQLCDLLDYLHQQHPAIIFGALKPETIMILPDHSIMLINFEKACYSSDTTTIKRDPESVTSYEPPELQAAEGNADLRSDLYSLGVILYEMLGGEIADTLHKQDLPALPTLSKTLNGIIRLATQADIQERFQSAHTLFLALERAYRIEERRAYQRSLDENTEAETEQSYPIHGSHLIEDYMTDVMPMVLDLDQRKLARESLQQMRLERLEQEQFEQQLASVDESLQRRSSISISQLSLHSFEEHPAQNTKKVFIPPPHRLIRMSFALALVLFVVMASLLIYTRLLQPKIEQVHITPTLPPPPLLVTAAEQYTSNWLKLPSLPNPGADNTAVYTKLHGREYIYMNGGYRGLIHPFYDYNLYRYDIAATHWETVIHNHFPSMINNAATVDEQQTLFFTAGYASESYRVRSLLYSYQPAENLLKKIVLPAQIHSGFAGSLLADQKGHLYLTQGFMHAGDPHARAGNGWYRYDIATDHWQRLADIPRGLGYGALATDGQNHILLFGGAEDAAQTHPTATIYSYDIVQDSWSQDPISMPQAISGASSCPIAAGKLALIGGYDRTHQKGLNSVWLFDLHTLKSQALVSFAAGGSVLGASACDALGHAYLVRGADNPLVPTSDFWKLSIMLDSQTN
jgi:serine/threonine protein kinase